MLRLICKSKLHRIRVTDTNLNYEGSIEIDAELLGKSDILPNEIVLVANMNSGARFETYVMRGEPGTGMVRLNGAAARLGVPGDELIVISYGFIDSVDARTYEPKVVLVDERNKIIEKKGR
jgi:aspartate 1-decarboxylase